MRAEDENIAIISGKCRGKLALQAILISTIMEYEALDKDGAPNARENSKRKKQDSLDGTLGHHQYIFGNWKNDLLTDLLAHIDPEAMDMMTLKAMPMETKKEGIECVTDIKMFGDEMDRIACTDKRTLLDSIKRVYEKLGRRLRYLTISVGDGTFAWGESAPWSIVSHVVADDGITVTCRLASWANNGRDHLDVTFTKANFLDDKGPFSLSMPFSIKQAYLVSETTGDNYSVLGLAPGIRRRLVRRVSDEEGATNQVTKSYRTYLKELTEKRSKPKAPTVGLKKLGQGLGVSSAPAGVIAEAAVIEATVPPATPASAAAAGASSSAEGGAAPAGEIAEAPVIAEAPEASAGAAGAS